MSTKKAAKNPSNEIGEQVAQKIAEQHQDLTARNWPDIRATMDADEEKEVKLAFSTVITNRPAEPGTVASKDSRIVTTLSFSLGKKSDKIDSPFPLANQPDLSVVKGPADPDLGE
jgi:hypothetical protein